ncbi:MAG: hypothetical protein LBR15_03925 [Methanobrevibacter sp.]|nr:hypothetical protein [Candidatus Methanovirga australis]
MKETNISKIIGLCFITLIMGLVIPLSSAGNIYIKSPDGKNHGGGDMYDEWTLVVSETVAGATENVININLKGRYYPDYTLLGHFGNSASKIHVYYELYQKEFWDDHKTFYYNYDLNNNDYGTVDNPKDIYMNLRSFFTYKVFYYSLDGGRVDFDYKPSNRRSSSSMLPSISLVETRCN